MENIGRLGTTKHIEKEQRFWTKKTELRLSTANILENIDDYFI